VRSSQPVIMDVFSLHVLGQARNVPLAAVDLVSKESS
jgi:hypothetical protein